MILNEIRLINESKATDAESAIKKAVMSVELKGSGATMSQKGIANLIGKFSNYLLKEEITNKDVSDMKNYLESVNKSYFSKK
tara:strand:+ start:81 stop:326 length:246 start_codon:yes stop_codon:yes gene_type:complete